MTSATLGRPPGEVRTSGPTAGSARGGVLQRRRDGLTALAFITPAMGMFTLFVILPALAAVGLSFCSWDLFTPPRWVGLRNYSRLFSDSEVWTSLKITIEFVVLGVIPTVVIGFLLATLINSKLRGISGLRILYFAPMVASSAVASVLWSYMYDPRAGVINKIAGWFGFKGEDWLSSTTWALPALTLMLIWLALPLVTILYLAGLQRIPNDIYAAASLDGAGAWRTLWSITWPNVVATTVLVTVLQILNFVSGSFEIALIMTKGNPLGHTETLTLYSYLTAFGGSSGVGDLGYGSALSIFQLAVLGLFVGLARAGQVIMRRRAS